MASPEQISYLQAMLDDLSTLAARDISAVWQRVSALPAGELRDYLVAAMPSIIDPFAAAAGQVSTQWYDDLAPTSRYRATPAGLPDTEAIAASTRWALGPLFVPTQTGDPLTMLAGFAQRAVYGVSRETMIENTRRETGALWARHASKNACSFCAMVATRGAVYSSKQAATRVGGRGMDTATNFDAEGKRKRGGQAKGVRARGNQKIGDKYHDHCHCIAVAVRPGQTYEPPSYVDQWNEAYKTAVKETPGKGEYGAIDTKAVLSHMRESMGSH